MGIFLFTGGAACGKSAHAEDFLCRRAAGDKLYLASMEPFGAEAQARIARHRSLRAGKGFQTAERFRDLPGFDPGRDYDGILLEDVGNLLANELFSPEGAGDGAVESILAGVEALSRRCEILVLVTNEIGLDGADYPPETQTYIRALGRLNAALTARCDGVARSVCGIPVPLKGEALF